MTDAVAEGEEKIRCRARRSAEVALIVLLEPWDAVLNTAKHHEGPQHGAEDVEEDGLAWGVTVAALCSLDHTRFPRTGVETLTEGNGAVGAPPDEE